MSLGVLSLEPAQRREAGSHFSAQGLGMWGAKVSPDRAHVSPQTSNCGMEHPACDWVVTRNYSVSTFLCICPSTIRSFYVLFIDADACSGYFGPQVKETITHACKIQTAAQSEL